MIRSNTLLLISNLAVIASVWLLVAHEFSRSSTPLAVIPPPTGNAASNYQRGGVTGVTSTSANVEIKKLEAELRTLSRYFKTTRKELGKMKCEKANADGVGDSGGFCLWGATSKFAGAGGNDILDIPMAKAFEQFLKGKDVYDFGCGVGRYGGYWLHGENVPASFPWKEFPTGPKLIKSWAGYDGSEGVEEVTDNFVQFLDLSVPAYMPAADWVVGLEVGEHVPKEFQTALLENFDRHNREGIILSWAVRGQGGHHHVNNLDNHEVISLVEQLGTTGYTYDKTQSEIFKTAATMEWFKNTVMVFRKNK